MQDKQLIKEMLLERYSTARPRGRDMKKLPKPYEHREVVFTCSNGWTIERLERADFAIEGFFMGHCLGGKDAVGCNGPYLSLREPDGTPHATIEDSYYVALYGRCNAYPKPEYVALINEWLLSAGRSLKDLHGSNSWGKDADDDYHVSATLSDRDYRDMPKGSWWRDSQWKEKRKGTNV